MFNLSCYSQKYFEEIMKENSKKQNRQEGFSEDELKQAFEAGFKFCKEMIHCFISDIDKKKS